VATQSRSPGAGTAPRARERPWTPAARMWGDGYMLESGALWAAIPGEDR